MNPRKVQMSFADYLANPAVGSSSLRTLLAQSPAHYWYDRQNPSEPTPAQIFGTIIHKAILEPIIFLKNSIVEPEFGGKGSVAARAEWYLEHHGKIIMKRHQYDAINGILNSITQHSKAFKFISGGQAEQSLFWTDPASMVDCKARPDFMREGHIIVDAKSTEDASYQAFTKSAATFGYHIQAAMYLDGATEVTDQKHDQFIVLAVEKNPPYAVNCFLMDESMVNEGRALYYDALKVLKRCQDAGKYPAYPEEIVSLSLPSWAYKIGGPNE